MRKLFTFIILAGIISVANAQIFTSSFENWTGGLPDGWMGSRSTIDSLYQITTGTQYGSNAVQLVNTEATSNRFTTQPLHVDGGTSYEIKFWAKGVGDVATRLYDTTYEGSVTYLSINTSSWTEYSQTVTAGVTVDTAQFMIYVRNTVGTDHIQLDSVAISTTTVSFVSVHDIQYTTDVSGDSPYNGQTVNTGGIVTVVEASGRFFVQGGPGAWDGIFVYDTQQSVQIGDSVTFTANVSEYNGLTELSGIVGLTVISSGNSLYAPVVITTGGMDEEYEGVLIKINNATCTNVDAGYGMWTIDDGSGALNTDDDIFAFTPTANEHYNVTGVGHYSYGEYKILPRDANDITISSGIEDINAHMSVSVFPNPAVNFFTIQSNQRIASVELFNVVGEKVHSFEGNKVNYPVSAFEAGVYFVKIYMVDGNVITKRIKLSK